MSKNCFGCEYYDGGTPGDNSLEGYEEPQDPMCCQPDLIEVADSQPNASVLFESILFWISEHGNCPLKRAKRPRSILDKSKTRSAYRSAEVKQDFAMLTEEDIKRISQVVTAAGTASGDLEMPNAAEMTLEYQIERPMPEDVLISDLFTRLAVAQEKIHELQEALDLKKDREE